MLTTGVYCRPGCPSRRPRRTNVRFYESAEAAEADGLRACQRCRPRSAAPDPIVERIRRLCEYIDRHAGERLTLTALSRRAGLSPFHLQRRFRQIVGVTPKAYVGAAPVHLASRARRA